MYKLQSAPKMIFLRGPRKPCTVTVQHYILEAAMALDVALIRNSDAAVIRAETTSQMRVSTSANLTKCFKLFIPGNSASARIVIIQQYTVSTTNSGFAVGTTNQAYGSDGF